MTGKELSRKIEDFGYRRAEIASLLGITEQHLNSRLKTTDVKYSFIVELSNATNKSVYDWLGLAEPTSHTPAVKKEEAPSEWQLKYFSLLEKYNGCLEEKNELLKQGRPTVKLSDKNVSK